jgi:hypothetical protein
MKARQLRNLATQRELREQIFKRLGEYCCKCGFSDRRALQIDHINGGGTRMRRVMSTKKIYETVLNSSGAGYQILCANYNWLKRHEDREMTRKN